MNPLLNITKIGPKLWVLNEPLVFEDVVVPKGFITDGASVPKAFQNILAPMSGCHAEAAILHDYRYSLDSSNAAYCNQKAADKEFYKNMLAAGTAKHRAWVAYMGVKACGKMSFRKLYSLEKVWEGAYASVAKKYKEEELI